MPAKDEHAVRRSSGEVEVPPAIDGSDDPRDDRSVGVENVRRVRIGYRVGRDARAADCLASETFEHDEVSVQGLVVRIPEAVGPDMDNAVASVLERGKVQHVGRTVRSLAVEHLDGEEAVAYDERFRAIRNGNRRGAPAGVGHAGDARDTAVEDPLLRGEGVFGRAPRAIAVAVAEGEHTKGGAVCKPIVVGCIALHKQRRVRGELRRLRPVDHPERAAAAAH